MRREEFLQAAVLGKLAAAHGLRAVCAKGAVPTSSAVLQFTVSVVVATSARWRPGALAMRPTTISLALRPGTLGLIFTTSSGCCRTLNIAWLSNLSCQTALQCASDGWSCLRTSLQLWLRPPLVYDRVAGFGYIRCPRTNQCLRAYLYPPTVVELPPCHRPFRSCDVCKKGLSDIVQRLGAVARVFAFSAHMAACF